MTKSPFSDHYIDLRGTPCPVNFIRCKLELEKIGIGQSIQVDIDKGEPEIMVLSGLKDAGYIVKILLKESNWLRLKVTSSID